jgi:hypothetical protein
VEAKRLERNIYCALNAVIMLSTCQPFWRRSLAIAQLRFKAVRDFFYGEMLWSVVIPTIDALKENIRRAIREIEPQTIDNVLQNCLNRTGYYLRIVVIL